MNRSLYFYVLDTMADWESGYVLAELNTGRYFRPGASSFDLVLVGSSMTAVQSLGGLRYTPQIAANECRPAEGDLLVLPGADTWLDEKQHSILRTAAQALDDGGVVAGICGATMGLANTGVLDDRKHTSNALQVLEGMCPGYSGASNYVEAKAVSHGNLITATGTAPVAFAYEIFKTLDVFKPGTLEAWFGLYETNDPMQFFALMQSIQDHES